MPWTKTTSPIKPGASKQRMSVDCFFGRPRIFLTRNTTGTRARAIMIIDTLCAFLCRYTLKYSDKRRNIWYRPTTDMTSTADNTRIRFIGYPPELRNRDAEAARGFD